MRGRAACRAKRKAHGNQDRRPEWPTDHQALAALLIVEEHKCPRCLGSLAPSYVGEARDKFLKCQHCDYLHDVRDAGFVETEEVEEYTDENGNRVTRTRRVMHNRSDFEPRKLHSNRVESEGPSFLITEGTEGFEQFNEWLQSVGKATGGELQSVTLRSPEELKNLGLGHILEMSGFKSAEGIVDGLDRSAFPNGGVIIDGPHAESILEQLKAGIPVMAEISGTPATVATTDLLQRQDRDGAFEEPSPVRRKRRNKSHASYSSKMAPAIKTKRTNDVLRMTVALLLGAVVALGFVVLNR